MSESNPHRSNSPSSGIDVKAPNIFERVVEEIDEMLHLEKPPHHHKESHGTRDDIDENTPLSDVKAPNMFERAKEEIEAFVQTIHPNKESTRNEALKEESKTYSSAVSGVKMPISIEETNGEKEAISNAEKSQAHHRHHKETHGTSDDIDENTPVDVVKGPNVFERAKEELEPKKDNTSDDHVSEPKKEGGFGFNIGRGLEKMCRPWGSKKN